MPKIAPIPPVAMMIASAGKVRTSMLRKIHGADATADAACIQNGAQELPVFVLGDSAFRFVAANLLVQGIEQLLARGGAGESGAMVERAAEAAKIEQPLRRAVESYAHPVQQVDDARARPRTWP